MPIKLPGKIFRIQKDAGDDEDGVPEARPTQ